MSKLCPMATFYMVLAIVLLAGSTVLFLNEIAVIQPTGVGYPGHLSLYLSLSLLALALCSVFMMIRHRVRHPDWRQEKLMRGDNNE